MMSEDLIEDSIHLGISSSNTNIDSLGGCKSIFEDEQVPCFVIEELSCEQCLDDVKVTKVFLETNSTKVMAHQDISMESCCRETFNDLNSNLFYSLYPDLFGGLDVQENTQDCFDWFSVRPNSNKVQEGGKMMI
jgi:hypothetical protein